MRIIAEGDKGYVYNGRFTGPVRLEMIVEAREPTEPDVARVHSERGAVTCWHSHPGGQILVLQSGIGRAGDRSGVRTGLRPGTTIVAEKDEPHWHGADSGSAAVWLAFTFGVTDWTEDNPLETGCPPR
ncbi:cupin domain-containing protein [Amycolatopsis silviterrae]|uniref:Cupin domain-containing protein n=1 Tax=Amycolatopsis silviterrae TaxID=1656914 RepID=A0ABW5HC03_9PSEU